jgi:hypothetical protein
MPSAGPAFTCLFELSAQVAVGQVSFEAHNVDTQQITAATVRSTWWSTGDRFGSI